MESRPRFIAMYILPYFWDPQGPLIISLSHLLFVQPQSQWLSYFLNKIQILGNYPPDTSWSGFFPCLSSFISWPSSFPLHSVHNSQLSKNVSPLSALRLYVLQFPWLTVNFPILLLFSLINSHSKFLSLFNYHIFRELLLPFYINFLSWVLITPCTFLHSRYDHTTVQVNMQLINIIVPPTCPFHSLSPVVLCAVPGRVCYMTLLLNKSLCTLHPGEWTESNHPNSETCGWLLWHTLENWIKRVLNMEINCCLLTHQSSILSMCKYLVIDLFFLLNMITCNFHFPAY